MKIKDSVFMITGGGSGLGAATARMIVNEGGKVLAVDVNEDAGIQLVNELGESVAFVKADVTDAASAENAINQCMDRFGRLDGLVNCAGVAPGEKVVGRQGPHGLESFQRAIAINLTGTFNFIRLAADVMSKAQPNDDNERGIIINTASVAAFDGQIGQAAYAASKAGVVGMTLPIARELARFGIRVMTVAPGIFETPMLLGLPQEVQDSLGQSIPFPSRLGKPVEYASLVRHIIENVMLNGEVIRLDGAIRMAPK